MLSNLIGLIDYYGHVDCMIWQPLSDFALNQICFSQKCEQNIMSVTYNVLQDALWTISTFLLQ